MADDGELVEWGTFRVDRKKALEKLKEFQLPDPTMFLLPWLRCAVASGASKITIQIDAAKTHLTMSFDGRPFGEGELNDPYGCLLDESTPENARNRHLAVGILAALRLGPPMRLRVTSGADSERRRLYIESLEQETLAEVQGPSHGTALEATFSGYWVNWKAALETVVRRYPVEMRTARLLIVDPADVQAEVERESRPQRKSAWLVFSDGMARGMVAVHEDTGRTQSMVRLYQCGVFVEEVESDLPMVPVVASINNDLFNLNVSQAGVVRDQHFEAAMRIVAEQAQKLLVQVSRAQGETLMPCAALRRRRDARRHWSRWWEEGTNFRLSWIKFGPFAGLMTLSGLAFVITKSYEKSWHAVGGFPDSDLTIIGDAISFFSFLLAFTVGLLFAAMWESREVLSLKQAGTIREAAWITTWVRKACGSVLDRDGASFKALGEAPIFLSAVDGPPLSLAELNVQRQQLGHVPFSLEPLPRKSASKVVWCVGEQDRADLEKFFPNQCRDVTDQ